MKTHLILINLSALYSGIVLFILFGGFTVELEVWQTVLIAVLPALITAVVTILVKRKSQMTKNTETIEKLKEELLRQTEGLKSDIGRGSKAALTEQHSDILSAINEKAEAEKKRLSKFSDSQKDTKRKVEEISDFLSDWERLIVENCRQKDELIKLTNENRDLTTKLLEQRTNELDKISSMSAELSQLKNDFKVLSEQNSKLLKENTHSQGVRRTM